MRYMLCLALFAAGMGVQPVTAMAQQTYSFTATHYGDDYNGHGTYCGSVYWGSDSTIVAVGPNYYQSLPCGTQLSITGSVGTIHASVQDHCQGCDIRNMLDLSEAGIIAVCGSLGSCQLEVVVQ